MNKILVTVLALMLVFAISASAQMPTDKGNMYIGGGLSFTSFSGDLYEVGDDSPSSFQIYPEFYYFLQNNLAVGGTVGYSKYSLGDYSDSEMGFGVGGKYYFNLNSELTEAKGAILPYAAANFMYVSMKEDDGTNEIKHTGYDINLAGGAVYMLSNSVGAYGQVGYTMESRSPEEGDSVDGAHFGFMIGVTYFIIK